MEKRNLPDRYTDLRIEKGISQTELASQLDCNKQYISKIESGERSLSLALLERYADFFNVSTDYLLGRTDIKSTNTTVQDFCEYIGCNEAVVDVFKYEYNRYIEDFEDEEYQKEYNSIINKILSSEELWKLIVTISSLYEDSKDHFDYYLNFSSVDIIKIRKALNVDADRLLLNLLPNIRARLLAEEADENLKQYYNGIDEIDDNDLDIRCDLSRYRASRELEYLLNAFDVREIRNSFKTKEHWLNYFKITEKELENYQSKDLIDY